MKAYHVRLTAGAVAAFLALSSHVAQAHLTDASRVAAVYDLILDARFDEAAARAKDACPPVADSVCQALAAASLWWQIQINPANRSLDASFTRAESSAIAAARAWTEREPARGEAWFYLGATYGPLVNWRVLRGEPIAAARDGRKIKDALERALALDPTLDDAYFGIGLYHYYADVAPAYAKLLRWLLLLPGGDRAAGLAEMLRARDHAAILRGEADFQLQQIYLWYERKPADAIAILESLDSRYPFNPLFLERLADARAKQLGDRAASADTWRRLRDRALAGRVYDAAGVARLANERIGATGARFF